MQQYQKEFIEFLVQTQALRFGEFRLKSGRTSPYFFNSGEFNTGKSIERLGYYYACAIRELRETPTLVFGPAYKGIPLCVSSAIALRQQFDMDIPYTFDRKEIKDHGEGGWLVGQEPTDQDRVVLVDDVVTDGATKIETISRLREALEANVTGLIIAVDRRETNSEGGDPIASLEASTGVEVRAIVNVHHILEHLSDSHTNKQFALKKEDRQNMIAYLAKFGIDG